MSRRLAHARRLCRAKGCDAHACTRTASGWYCAGHAVELFAKGGRHGRR